MRISSVSLDYAVTFKDGFDARAVDLSTVQSSFDKFIEDADIDFSSLLVYGASVSGALAVRLFKSHHDVVIKGFVDIAEAKKEFLGYPVSHPSSASWEPALLVAVSPGNYLSVMRTLHPVVPKETEIVFLWANEFFDPRTYHLISPPLEQDQANYECSDLDKDEKALREQVGADGRGRIFFRGENTYRLILDIERVFYEEVLRDEARLDRLIGCGLVETRIVEVGFSPGSLTVEHLSFVPQKPKNWTSSMFKDAALFFLKFWREVALEGCSLRDSHSGNVMFQNNSEPCFVDFCSLGPYEATTLSSHLLNEFFESWIYPLALLKSRKYILFRELLKKANEVPLSSLKSVCSDDVLSSLAGLRAGCEQAFQNKDLSSFFEVCCAWVENISLLRSEIGWNSSEYQSELDSSDAARDHREEIVLDLAATLKPKNALDLGCNKGRFSVLLAKRGIEVVAVDSADSLLDDLYIYAKDSELSILPYVEDVSQMKPFWEPRTRFDLTLALALIHHIVFRSGKTVTDFLSFLDGITINTLVLEYIAPDKEREPFVYDNYVPSLHPDYNLASLKRILLQNWSSVEEREISPTRTLLIAKRGEG